MAGETTSREPVAPKASPVAEPTEEGKLAQVRRDVNKETRKQAIEQGDPIAKMKLNIAWANQYPDHDLAKAIKGLGNYGDLTTDKKAAEAAVTKMIEIQKKIGISDAKGQDGIIGRGTLKTFETKDKAKEQKDAQDLIAELDQSLYTPDLQKKTEQARKEKPGFLSSFGKAGKSVLSGEFQAGLKEVKKPFGDTKVTDAKGNDYKVSTSAEGKPQYTNKDGEVFEINKDNKLVSIKKQAEENKTKMDSLLTQAKSAGHDFTAENPLGEGQLSAYYNEKGEFDGIKNAKGDKYNQLTGKFEAVGGKNERPEEQTHEMITKAIRKGVGKDYKEANGRFFTVEKDENGQLTAFRSKGGSTRDEYYNAEKKEWMTYNDEAKKERKSTYLASSAGENNSKTNQDENFLGTKINYNGQDFTVGKMQLKDLNEHLVKFIGNPGDKLMAQEIAKSVKQYPALGSLTVEQYKRFQKDPADFILSQDTDNNPLFRNAVSYTDGKPTYAETRLLKGDDFDLSKITGFGKEGEMYKKDPDTQTWSRQIGDKIQIGDGGKFISIEEYLINNSDKLSPKTMPTLVGGYELTPTGNNQVSLFKGLTEVKKYQKNNQDFWLAKN